MTEKSFGNSFKDACRTAGARDGARAQKARRNARSEITAELEALFGWRGGRMTSLYTRNAKPGEAGAWGDGKDRGAGRKDNFYRRT